jgi:hypothetical protein
MLFVLFVGKWTTSRVRELTVVPILESRVQSLSIVDGGCAWLVRGVVGGGGWLVVKVKVKVAVLNQT